MRFLERSHISLLAAAIVAFVASPVTRADDTEIFVSQPANNVQANILLIIDTSGSMNLLAESTLEPYDPTFSYSNTGTGSCSNKRIYYSNSAEAPTSCTGLSYIEMSADFTAASPGYLKCKRAIDSLAWGTGATGTGFYSDKFIRWRDKTWQNSLSNGTDVECNEDSGTHGANATDAAKWPEKGSTNSNQTNGRWTSTATDSWWGVANNTGTSTTLYSANYIRYLKNGPRNNLTRMAVVKAAAASFLNSLPNLNVGVMRYSTNSHQYGDADSTAAGGMVMSPVSPLNDKRATLINEISGASSKLYLPHGWTPLSETLYEAYRYMSGGEVLYGNNSKLCDEVNTPAGSNGTCTNNSHLISHPSVAAAISGAKYISPMTESCQANYIVFLTDGEATKDTQSNTAISGLSGESCSGDGGCLGALTQYMFENDLRPDVEFEQNIRTFFIGFGADFSGNANAFAKLQSAADRGGGSAYQADDLSSLSSVFNAIVTNILQTSTTFTTPTVAVNAFNRTRTLDDLFVSVFQPNSSAHWPGNLKKYRVDNGVIKDSSTPAKEAVDPNTGFFSDASRSFWSASADGALVAAGGAANQIPAPAARKLYTYVGNAKPGSPVALSSHPLATTNDALDTALGLTAPGDPTPDELIEWARGVDSLNEDGDTATTVRHVMGDPIHAPPAVVIYGGTTTTPDINDAVVFLTTNDGYLHAIDTVSGRELWAYVPQEFLPNLKELYFDNPVVTKPYALDGELTVLKYDVNGDGIVGTNDRVILFFGTGRGGNRYYAIDVTDKDDPEYLWSIGPSDLPGIGQTWSAPVIARMNIAGKTQNSQKLVLVMGGGYDTTQDSTVYNSEDSVGNKLFVIDAIRGSLLWSAGKTGADLNLTRMTHSIPGGIAVLDTNSDGFADRMYAGDMAAQLWRFDITNGNDADELAAGGVLASLGAKDLPATTSAADLAAAARRFYSRPDVAALQRTGAPPILNIAIGSGYRGHPLNTSTRDRFYSIRDTRPFAPMTQDDYDDLTILSDADLTDITTDVDAVMPVNSAGWKLLLNRPNWRGEKSLSPANTFDNKVFFTTYTPPAEVASDPNTCSRSSSGSNRAYVVNAFNGAPVPRRDGEDLDPDDRYEDLAQGGIAPEVSFLFPGESGDDDPNEDPNAEPKNIVCLSGVEVLDVCKNFNSRIKTYWRELTAP